MLQTGVAAVLDVLRTTRTTRTQHVVICGHPGVFRDATTIKTTTTPITY